MRPAATLLLALLVLGGSLVPHAGVRAASCGRAGYPDAQAHQDESVVDRTLWDALVAAGGFANATEGVGRVEVRVGAAAVNYTVTLEEVVVREYVGTRVEDVTAVRLRIAEERAGGPTVVHDFAPVGFSGRSGGNLTLSVAVRSGGVEAFWRWAYLVCDPSFPNDYFVFHALVDDGRIAQENALLYFEATRPRREPPVDLILLITAGIAASAIFLLAHRALRKG